MLYGQLYLEVLVYGSLYYGSLLYYILPKITKNRLNGMLWIFCGE